MQKILLPIFLFVFFFTSCTTSQLSKKDKDWLPYKKGQKIIFESSLGKLDTIVCVDTSMIIADDNMYNPFSSKIEEINVVGESPKGYYSYKFAEISVSKDRHTRLHLNAFPGESWFYDLEGFKVDSLAALAPEIIKTKNRSYNDVYALYPTYMFNRKSQNNYIRVVYFSKRYGIIKFERTDGVNWELKSGM